MKRLLFCTGSFITGKGGVASYAHDFVEQFAEIYDFVIVTADNYKDNDGSCVGNVIQCNAFDLSVENANYLLSIIHNANPDIIINSGFPLLSLVVPFVPDEIKVVSVSHFVNGCQAWYAGFNGEYVDTIIALSSYGSDYIKRKFAIRDENKVKTLKNFMPPSMPNYERKKNNRVLKIVYPGGSTYNKSSEIVCHALKRLLKTDFQFEFYWLGNNTLANAGLAFLPTKTINDCLGYDDRIKHIGPVSRSEAKQIISEANLFLLPSRGEGFPITLIEAMRYGCIPIVSDAKHGSLDAIDDKVNGFVVKQGSSKILADTICDILTNHSSFHYIYENSYDYYCTYLTDSIWHGEMQDFLNESLQHNTRYLHFDDVLYQRIRSDYKKMFRGYALKDRLRYVRLFFYFRYVRYFV